MGIRERAEHSQEFLRNKRNRLFKAFDIYKQNVAYGLVQETSARHSEIATWYNLCLDLDYDALTNYPSELEKYL